MNLLLIADNCNWAFGSIANNIKTHLDGFNVTIVYTSEFASPIDFLKFLKKKIRTKTILHFFWRDYLLQLMDVVREYPKYSDLLIQNCITTHIPDHLFTYKDIVEYEKRIPLMNFIDGYCVTSKKLSKLYSGLADIPAPHSVIYDNPEIISNNLTFRAGELKTIVWIGNSTWGEYLGFNDYKGLNQVISPALVKLREAGYQFNYVEFDSSKGKIARDVILQTLVDADILLIASESEGTPLPLLEGMANGCAIVTTDVGIAKEILPKSQHQYIVSRNSEAFYFALQHLLENKTQLHEIQKQNHLAYYQKFVESNQIIEQWALFFKDIYAKPQNVFKVQFFKNSSALSLKTRISRKFATKLYQLGVRLNLVDFLKQVTLVRHLYYKMTKPKLKLKPLDYVLLEDFYTKKIADKEIIALYSSYWSGVASSTVTFFQEDSIQFPYYSHEFPQVKHHVYLERLVDQLASSKTLKSIVMSGGNDLQIEIAKAIYKKNPTIKVYFGWHGSPAQWSDAAQYMTFDLWYRLYQQKMIQGVISFKIGLDDMLRRFDITTYSVANYAVSMSSNPEPRQSIMDGDYKIGLFSAMFSWYKNPFPQLLAIGSLERCELITNLHLEQKMDWITSQIKLSVLKENLSNQCFIALLSRLHVVCYVTNTECSPMIALEAVGVGTPCLVGPAGNIYKGFPELESYLVVHEVDNPESIRNRLQLVRDHYSKITALLDEFVVSYNSKLDVIKYSLYTQLKK